MPIKVVKRYKIKEALNKIDRSQSWLVRELNKNGYPCTIAQMSLWCSSERRPSIDVLYAIANVLDIKDVRKLWEVK